MITDDQIFNHMMPGNDSEECEKCDGEIEDIEYDEYITYKCLNCGFEPSPPEEV